MTSTAELQANTLVRGTKVKLVEEVAGYPAGSKGKVALANGFTWKRYWVRFEDGKLIGHIDHNSLIKHRDFDKFTKAKQRQEAQAAIDAEAEAQAASQAETDEPAAQAKSGQVVVNGVVIPQRLLDMSAAARKRLSA